MAEFGRNRYNIPEEAGKPRRATRVYSLRVAEFFKVEIRVFRPSFFPKKRMQGGFDFWNLWE
jgi:hypothetical protein